MFCNIWNLLCDYVFELECRQSSEIRTEPSVYDMWLPSLSQQFPQDTSNWILITERIPFGKQDGDRAMDPAYDKMKDSCLPWSPWSPWSPSSPSSCHHPPPPPPPPPPASTSFAAEDWELKGSQDEYYFLLTTYGARMAGMDKACLFAPEQSRTLSSPDLLDL